MRSKFSVLINFLLAFSLFSCNRNQVSLDFTNAKDEVAPLTNLVFRFDKTLIADSLVNRWDSTKYISLDPAIAGKFRWEHGDELVFSPSAPLLPATNYRATLNNDILQFSKFDRIGNSKDIQFHTAELKLENTNSSWVLQGENSKNYVPQMDLYFNFPVDPVSLKDKLKITLDDKPVPFTLQTLSASNKISVRLTNIPTADKDYEIKLQLDKGLIPVGGSNGTADMASVRAMIPSPFILRINEVQANPDGAGGTIQVSTSQHISSTDLASHIQLDPAVKFNTEITETGFLIHSDHFNLEKTYLLTIKKGLRGEIGGSLVEDYINNLAFGALEPAISFQNGKGIYLSGKGEKNVEVRITNVEKVKLIISKIYENNLLSSQRNNYYPQENEGDNNYYEDNAGFTPGDVIYEKDIDSRLLPKYGGSRLLHMDMEDKLPEFKGIYHVAIRSAKDYWVRDSRYISLSDIGLIAKEGTEKIIVFANSIQSATPLKGVNMIAYGANNQVLGMATSDDQGVATIQFLRREFAGFKPAMIIAKTSDDFNYLPFSTTRVNTSRFDVGGKTLNMTGLDAFIYPERDIYRPGEKINY